MNETESFDRKGILYKASTDMARTMICILELFNVATYGALVEGGGLNVNLVDRMSWEEKITRKEFIQGISRVFDEFAPKGDEGRRKVSRTYNQRGTSVYSQCVSPSYRSCRISQLIPYELRLWMPNQTCGQHGTVYV